MNIKTKIENLEKRIEKTEYEIEKLKLLMKITPKQGIFGDLLTDSIKDKVRQVINKKYDKILKDDGLDVEFKR